MNVSSPVKLPPEAPTRNRARTIRRVGLTTLVLLIVLGGLGYGTYWYTYLDHYVSTDDAYVSGDIVQITSEVPGTVIALHVDDTQIVHRGDALLELDPADAEVAMESARAGLGQAVRQVRALFAEEDQLRAEITEHEVALKRAQDDYRRRSTLESAGAVSREELSHAQDAITEQTAALTAARKQLDETMAQTAGTTIATHPTVLNAATRLRDAALALRRTRITAPVDGVIAKRTIEVGQRVAPGTPLMALVPLGDVWVDANFKEVQLRRMRVGQPVTLRSDLYGSAVTYHGRVAGFSAGTGNTFSLLPAQNATGNWIKIVQRVPVRIVLDPQELKAHPLRMGLSMVVDVDIADESGTPAVAAPLRNEPLPAKASDADDLGVNAMIEQIIADNASPFPPATAGGKP